MSSRSPPGPSRPSPSGVLRPALTDPVGIADADRIPAYPAIMSDDRFGLRREAAILDSGVREVFTPHTPVREIDMLFGRDEQVASLIEDVNTRGQHSLLFGERGVGKSSLANGLPLALEIFTEKVVFFKRCDSLDCFETLLQEPLQHVGIELNLVESTLSTERAKSGQLRGGPLSLGGRKGEKASDTYQRPEEVSPGHAARELAELDAVLIIDEADAIRVDADRLKLAEFMKLLSDHGSLFTVVVVGIAETAVDLTAGHPSVGRCLSETELDRLSGEELADIVKAGAQKCGLSFSSEVVEKIVDCSAGYPHFTHLLALKCAEMAVAADRSAIDVPDLVAALAVATKDAEGSLRTSYQSAIRAQETDMYRIVLQAASAFGTVEFRATQLRSQIESITGETITQNTLNNYFQRLIDDTGSRVLRRVGKGVYRFSDPRMPSYVRIANQML